MADANGKVYVPKQKVKRGVAGYKGRDVIVVDEHGKETPAKPTTKNR